jgi:tRNA (guanine37-N1)-methyltransferase
MRLKDLLKNKLPEEELELVPSSYDIIGSREKAVAVIEIPEELQSKKKLIGGALLKLHKNVKSVLVKKSERKGTLRLREYEVIAGDENTEVIHKEHGCSFKLDPQKVYFSPREATERQRIAKQVKPYETIIVFFSGIACYPIVIAKTQPDVEKVIAIEINEYAHNYAVENIRINKLSHKVVAIHGDVKQEAKRFYGKCDRVVMPLPKGAYKFLDEAIQCLKANGIVHFYHWANEDDLFSEAIKLIRSHAEKFGKKVEILSMKKVLPYAPRVWKVCIDCKIS